MDVLVFYLDELMQFMIKKVVISKKVLNKSAFFISCAGVATPDPVGCAAAGGEA
jgi:hypothetical protein